MYTARDRICSPRSVECHGGKSRLRPLLFFSCLSGWVEQAKRRKSNNLLVFISLRGKKAADKLGLYSSLIFIGSQHSPMVIETERFSTDIQLAKSHLINLYEMTSKPPWSWGSGLPCLGFVTVYPQQVEEGGRDRTLAGSQCTPLSQACYQAVSSTCTLNGNSQASPWIIQSPHSTSCKAALITFSLNLFKILAASFAKINK